MKLNNLYELAREWDMQNNGESVVNSYFQSTLSQLEYHAQREWSVFLPTEYPEFNKSYMERLAAWVGNVSNEEDQKLLLKYATYINFFSHNDFIALYRTALERFVRQWVADQISSELKLSESAKFQHKIDTYINRRIWFCPVTDSMDINEFYKVNHLKGISHRPGFATLQMLTKDSSSLNTELINKISEYMKKPDSHARNSGNSLESIVLLEDVVGSGTQCIKAVRWAIGLGKPVLFIPLILCPNGEQALRKEEANSNGLLTVSPVILLSRKDLLGPERKNENGWPISDDMENLVKRYSTKISPERKNMYGFKSTGCSITTFSNTPNNTLPIVHNKPKKTTWEPLFPRVYRD